MNRALISTFALSVGLHAGALALTLALSAESEGQARPLVTIDVAWMPADSTAESDLPSGSGPPATRAPAAEAAGPPAAHPSRRDFARGEIAPQDEVAQLELPHPEEPIAAVRAIGIPKEGPSRATPARRRETIETAPSRPRRQIVADRAANSHAGESSWTPDMHVAIAAASAEQTSKRTGNEAAISRATRESHTDQTNSMAAGSEIVYRVAPAYPLAARRRGLEGAVLLHVRFDASGQPEEISVMTSSGSAMLDDAAREAAARWRFRGGAPGAVELPFTFRLAADGGVASSVQ